jgi:uncharacterized protein YcbX
MPEVAWLSIAPVKGLALVHSEELVLGPEGVAENRRFYLVDAAGVRYSVRDHGPLVQVQPRYDADAERLTLSFPDGTVADGEVALGEEIVTDFYGRDVSGRAVEGPWNAALSAHAGEAIRLVKTDRLGAGVDRGGGPVTLVSEASLAELAHRSDRSEPVDGRRFRMLVGLEGCRAHEEDEWCGRELRIGEAVVRVLAPVARCAATTRNPDTGERDFDTLHAIKAYRGLREGKNIDFGVVGEVARPGRIRVGDRVEPAA